MYIYMYISTYTETIRSQSKNECGNVKCCFHIGLIICKYFSLNIQQMKIPAFYISKNPTHLYPWRHVCYPYITRTPIQCDFGVRPTQRIYDRIRRRLKAPIPRLLYHVIPEFIKLSCYSRSLVLVVIYNKIGGREVKIPIPPWHREWIKREKRKCKQRGGNPSRMRALTNATVFCFTSLDKVAPIPCDLCKCQADCRARLCQLQMQRRCNRYKWFFVLYEKGERGKEEIHKHMQSISWP